MDRRVFIRQTAVAALGGLVAFDLSKASTKREMAFAGKEKSRPGQSPCGIFLGWRGVGPEPVMRTGTKYWTSSRNGV